ncbi:MAG: hypothetical protein AABZ64_00670, partial [Nitrospinota bacterium]
MIRILVAVFLAGALWFPGAPGGAQAAKQGGTLRIAIEGNVPHLDGTVALGLIIKFYREVAGSNLM